MGNEWIEALSMDIMDEAVEENPTMVFKAIIKRELADGSRQSADKLAGHR